MLAKSLTSGIFFVVEKAQLQEVFGRRAEGTHGVPQRYYLIDTASALQKCFLAPKPDAIIIQNINMGLSPGSFAFGHPRSREEPKEKL